MFSQASEKCNSELETHFCKNLSVYQGSIWPGLRWSGALDVGFCVCVLIQLEYALSLFCFSWLEIVNDADLGCVASVIFVQVPIYSVSLTWEVGLLL